MLSVSLSLSLYIYIYLPLPFSSPPQSRSFSLSLLSLCCLEVSKNSAVCYSPLQLDLSLSLSLYIYTYYEYISLCPYYSRIRKFHFKFEYVYLQSGGLLLHFYLSKYTKTQRHQYVVYIIDASTLAYYYLTLVMRLNLQINAQGYHSLKLFQDRIDMEENKNMEERLLPTRAAEGTSSRGGSRGNLKITGRIWTETKKIWRIAFPAILGRMTSFGLIIVTQSFIGHISALDLAAYALVQTFTVRFCNGVLLGMSSATETLCGQAFGARQYHMMGIYLQRSWIVDLVTATILLPLFIFATPIYKLLGQETAIAEAAENTSLWFIAVIYSFVFTLTIQMYLQAQLKNQIIGWLSSATFVIHIALSWVFVRIFGWGQNGALGALALSSWLVPIGEFVYIFGGWCPNSWKGFTTTAFSDLWPVIKLSVSSGIMLCLELWYNSILVLVAGYMENAEVAISALSICLNISLWQFMLCLGFLGATSVRVSNELGAGNAKAAKFAIRVVFMTSVAIGLICFVLCLIFGKKIAYLFTSEEEVAETVSQLSVLLAFTMLFNSIQPVLTGAAVGSGLQSRVAVINLGCYYVIGIPVGVLLAYAVHLQVQGIWIGMISGVVAQVVALGIMIWRTDWNEQVGRAAERLNRWFMKPTEESNEGLPNHSPS
ncbi:hypothetical protein NMG60_11031123 [Bertholletia excelsa]